MKKSQKHNYYLATRGEKYILSSNAEKHWNLISLKADILPLF